MNHVNAIRCNDEYQCSHCGKSWDIHEEAPDCKMTFNPIEVYKAVNYFGIALMVPKAHCFIATDRSGNVFSYLFEPEIKGDMWLQTSSHLFLGSVNLHGLDWRETLRKC